VLNDELSVRNYSTIQSDIHPGGQRELMKWGYVTAASGTMAFVGKGLLTQQQAEEKKLEHQLEYERKLGNIKPVIRDVVTLRKRDHGTPPTLFEVVELLKPFQYTEIHCAFCRVDGPDYEEFNNDQWSDQERAKAI
jgi:hypothetical protein